MNSTFMKKYMLAKFLTFIAWSCNQLFCTARFRGRRNPIFMSTFYSSVFDTLYELTGGLPGSSTEEVAHHTSRITHHKAHIAYEFEV